MEVKAGCQDLGTLGHATRIEWTGVVNAPAQINFSSLLSQRSGPHNGVTYSI